MVIHTDLLGHHTLLVGYQGKCNFLNIRLGMCYYFIKISPLCFLSPDANPSKFRENIEFTNDLHEVLKQNCHTDPEMIEQADREGEGK